MSIAADFPQLRVELGERWRRRIDAVGGLYLYDRQDFDRLRRLQTCRGWTKRFETDILVRAGQAIDELQPPAADCVLAAVPLQCTAGRGRKDRLAVTLHAEWILLTGWITPYDRDEED